VTALFAHQAEKAISNLVDRAQHEDDGDDVNGFNGRNIQNELRMPSDTVDR